jgi:hypothetical protein
MKLTDCLQELGRPVAYYPKLSHITGGVKETLFLCQLLYWEGKQANKEGWIYKTQQEMFEETGLTRYEQETARRNLKNKGFIEEKLQGIPAKLHYKINFKAINEAWAEFVEEETANNNVDEQQTSMGKSNKQACGNITNSDAETQQTITENTTENTTETTTKDIESTSSKDKKNSLKEDVPYKEIVQAYNDICKSLPSVRVISDKRKKKMRVIYREVGDLDVITEAFKKAENSDFLSGRNGKWGGCNFDWLINYNNFIKVIEGTYDNRNEPHGEDNRVSDQNYNQNKYGW